jgi:hypothetical protein
LKNLTKLNLTKFNLSEPNLPKSTPIPIIENDKERDKEIRRGLSRIKKYSLSK